MSSYPYTIDNGRGERLTFTGVVHRSDGEYAEAEGLAQPGAGAPMHVHHFQEEAVQVVSGRLGYQVSGRAPQFAGPGELVVWPAGTAHKWWNAGDTELRTTGWCKPPHNVEFFLGTLFASTKEHGGRPGLWDAAFLLTRYRREFTMLEMPAVMRHVVMPVVYIVGKLTGKYDKYTTVPDPIVSGGNESRSHVS